MKTSDDIHGSIDNDEQSPDEHIIEPDEKLLQSIQWVKPINYRLVKP